jgi:hypothetical protein
MTDCMHNINLISLLQQNSDSSRATEHQSSKFVEIPHRENADWCLVSTDGSTSYIGCKSESNSRARRPVVPEPTELPDVHGNELPSMSEYEPGVDLSYLEVESDTASKLIAGMHAMTTDQSTPGVRRAVAMPSTKTDLHEIFKSDKVCIVNNPRVEKAVSKSPPPDASSVKQPDDTRAVRIRTTESVRK